MKKVFALLSVLALTFVMVGLAAQPTSVEAAPAFGKWFEDPTLEVGEIPFYVAGSVATTFPNYFDEAGAKGTEFEDKAHRVGDVYPWNETKVIMPRYDEDGKVVGSFSVYPLGSNVATGNAAGQMVFRWIADGAGYKVNSTFGWVSLSQVRHNYSGQAVRFETYQTRTGEVEGKGSTTAHIVFDGDGKAVRGVIGGSYFVVPDENPVYTHIAPIFGYKDGKLVKIVDEADLDRLMVASDEDDLERPILDNDGEPVLDQEGNPTYHKLMVESELPHLAYLRYAWQYYDEAPTDLNAVSYLEEGWRADLWDYYDAETGLAYQFISTNDGHYGAVTAEQAAVHNATVGSDAYKATTTVRPQFRYIDVPVDGIYWDFGYLERIANGGVEYNKFREVFVQAMEYGRTESYVAYSKAFNFSSKPITVSQGIFEGKGYMPLDGTEIFEVLPNTSFKPSWLANISGMLGGFTDLNDILSYKNLSESELKIEVDVNGKKEVYDIFALSRYLSREEMVTDFVRDFYYYLKDDRAADALPAVPGTVDLSSFEVFAHGAGKTSGFEGTWVNAMQAYVMWENSAPRPTAADKPEFFITHPNYYEKWLPLFDVFDEAIKVYSGTAAGLWGVGAYTPVRRVNLYVQNKTLGAALDIVPADWIYTPHTYKYVTWAETLDAFLDDFYVYLKDDRKYFTAEEVSLEHFKTGTSGTTLVWRSYLGFTEGNGAYGNYPLWGHYAAKPAKGDANFAGQYYDKWMWLFEHFHDINIGAGIGAGLWSQSAWTPCVNFYVYMTSPTTLFTATHQQTLADNELTMLPIYVKDSGFVEYLPPAYRDFVINSGSELNRRFVIDMRVWNTATGAYSEAQMLYVVTDNYTPLLEIDQAALFAKSGQTSIDLATIAKAYDRNYSEQNRDLKGWEISQNIVFDYPAGFDPNNLAQGKHEIQVSITSGSKTVSKRVVLTVPDTIRPVVIVRHLSLAYGANYHPLDGIAHAWDAVDGNLFNATYQWYLVVSDPIDTRNPGTYTVEVEVYDRSGNIRSVDYQVIVGEKEFDVDDLLADIEDMINDAIEDGGGDLVAPAGCAAPAAAYFVSVIAVLGVALLVFRKRQ